MHMYIYIYMLKKEYIYIYIHVNIACIYVCKCRHIYMQIFVCVRLKVFFFHDFPPCDFNQRPPQVPFFARPSVHGQGDAWRGR